MTEAGDKYRLGARLGTGGMAEVFRGELVGEAGFTRPIAIKRILPGFSNNREFVQMFEREALLASKLHHHNIVAVLDYTRDREGRLMIVMEMVDGADLFEIMQAGPMSPSLAAFVISEVLKALAYAHGRAENGRNLGIVHRDVSPPNVLISTDGAVKLNDFGIAKMAASAVVSQAGIVKGKLGYLSPEQAEGGALDGRSDVFAAGVVLHEMLTGRPLFAGVESAQAIFHRTLNMEIPSPAGLVPEVPELLSSICLKMLERDLARRFDSQGALRALLDCGVIAADAQAALARTLAERRARRPAPALPSAPSTALMPEEELEQALGDRAVVESRPAQKRRPRTLVIAPFLAVTIAAATLAWLGVGKVSKPIAPPAEERRETPMTANRSPLERMVLIGEGAFMAGCAPTDTDCDDDEGKFREERLAEFEIDVYETTVAEFRACIDAGACSDDGLSLPYFREEGEMPRDHSEWSSACNWNEPARSSHPINCVSWHQADAYCKWRNKRLPSELEWERAARGIDGRIFPWGAALSIDPPRANLADMSFKKMISMARVPSIASYDDRFGGTAPVGSFPEGRSPSGIHDAAGNVWEWTSSKYGAQGDQVTRGGGYGDIAANARTSARGHSEPDFRLDEVGFRCAR